MKKGRLSKKEMAIVAENVDTLTPQQIAEMLDRDAVSIGKYIKKNHSVGMALDGTGGFELEDRPYWSVLEQQFEKEELVLLKYFWGTIISQFKDDVTPTEEMQVVDLVKLDMLMNRCLIQNREAVSQIAELQRLVTAERDRDKDQQDLDLIFNLERQAGTLLSSQENVNKDYRELQTKKNSMLKEMKATREQRVKRLEDSQKSFTGWIIHMMSNPEITVEYGIQMEKMKLAMEAERDRLSQLHQYQDGIVDQPFLTPDTVIGRKKK